MISTYYLNGSIFSIVPRHVREDFAWMAEHGYDAVCISAYERDVGREMMWELYCREAERAGLKVLAVPSRWGGLVAGWPGAPSRFSVGKPETWILRRDGSPAMDGSWGVMSSVHHPATEEFFIERLNKLTAYPIAGIVWDEIKPLGVEDFSPAARAKAPLERAGTWDIDATCAFFDRITKYAKSRRSELTASAFVYGTLHDATYLVDRLASIEALDHVGLDGRPWRAEDNARVPGFEGHGNLLLPAIETFKSAARRHGKGLFALVENMGIPLAGHAVIAERLPEVLAHAPAHLSTYYYGADCDEPELLMKIVGDAVRAYARGRKPPFDRVV